MSEKFGIVWMVFSLFLFGCASAPYQPISQLHESDRVNSQKIEPEARTLFFQAERAFQARQYDKAQRGFLAVRSKFPGAQRAAMVSTYRLGVIHYYFENYSEAAKEFNVFLKTYPDSELHFDAKYNLGAAEYQMGNHQKTFLIISGLQESEIRLQGVQRAEIVYQLWELSAEATNNHDGAVKAYSQHAELPVSESRRASLINKATFHLNRIVGKSSLDRLLSEVSQPTIRNLITQRMGTVVTEESGETVYVPPPQQDEEISESIEETLHSDSVGERLHVGVILPLSGQFEKYGVKALEGIMLAAGNFHEEGGHNFRLFIEDTQSNSEIARRAVDKLVYQNSVIAIIGPLNWKESLAVAERSQQLGVLNISLVSKEGISAKGAYLFQNALTPGVQLEPLISYCMEEKKFRRFAVLAPGDSYGLDMAYQFWDLVEKKGGRIVAFKTYPPNEGDFQEYIVQMTGLDNPRYRRRELEQLEVFKKEQKEKTGREPKAGLPPIIDFEAIFLPDSPSKAAQIAASMAYFDVDGVTLLGTTEWYTDKLYKLGGRRIEGALFPGGLSLNSGNPLEREFIQLFTSSFRNFPDLLSGQSYEAMKLIIAALEETSSRNRNMVVKEMMRFEERPSVLGNVTFTSTRIARRKLPIYKLGSGGSIIRQN